MQKRITITSALPYANGPLHIGHLAGVYIPADIYARFQRKKGNDVLFVGGSDEHGIPITIRAKKENKTPQEVVDEYHELIKNTLSDFGVSYDNYSRTSAKIHEETSQDFFLKLYESGKFEEKETEQFYDEKAGEFLADRYIMGTCPNCGNEDAYGDQCEKCGSTLSPTELINPRSMLSGEIPVKKVTKHWYFPLNEYEDFLTKWILEGHKDDWRTNVYGQVKSWINDGLKPRAMTRDLNWGVPVPTPKNPPKDWDSKGKVLYVWFDAPIGYISSTKEWAKNNDKNWEDYWKNPDTKLVHFIGKDNIVFHCIIFPSMLKSHGEYILPENVPANEFLNLENDKISTSRNWAVWAHEYLKDFPDKQDVLRYVLTANAPETKDNNFTWKDFQTKNNSELVAILGNFINRVLVLTNKYYEGKVPDATIEDKDAEEIKGYVTKVNDFLEKYEFRNALAEFMNLARFGNQYLQANEPWKKLDNPEEVEKIMFTSIQITGALAQLMEAFMPFTSKKLMEILNVKSQLWNDAEFGKIQAGHTFNEPQLLFEKIEDSQVEQQVNKLLESKKNNMKTNPNAEDAKTECTFDDFTKIDLRVCTILEAEKVEKTDKLMKLKVDTGVDVRTVVSGISQSFSAEELIGKQVTILLNLAPRKIRGIESQGMLLLADKEDGKLTFISPEEKVENGTIVG
ncbi:MAG: methionine--tRNA ligase [Flavobacteriales bacterium]|nr:methionine--tRNA ligase [Flavobacteriales bacterium]